MKIVNSCPAPTKPPSDFDFIKSLAPGVVFCHVANTPVYMRMTKEQVVNLSNGMCFNIVDFSTALGGNYMKLPNATLVTHHENQK